MIVTFGHDGICAYEPVCWDDFIAESRRTANLRLAKSRRVVYCGLRA